MINFLSQKKSGRSSKFVKMKCFDILRGEKKKPIFQFSRPLVLKFKLIIIKHFRKINTWKSDLEGRLSSGTSGFGFSGQTEYLCEI